ELFHAEWREPAAGRVSDHDLCWHRFPVDRVGRLMGPVEVKEVLIADDVPQAKATTLLDLVDHVEPRLLSAQVKPTRKRLTGDGANHAKDFTTSTRSSGTWHPHARQ